MTTLCDVQGWVAQGLGFVLSYHPEGRDPDDVPPVRLALTPTPQGWTFQWGDRPVNQGGRWATAGFINDYHLMIHIASGPRTRVQSIDLNRDDAVDAVPAVDSPVAGSSGVETWDETEAVFQAVDDLRDMILDARDAGPDALQTGWLEGLYRALSDFRETYGGNNQ